MTRGLALALALASAACARPKESSAMSDAAATMRSPPRVLRIGAREAPRHLFVFLHGYGSRAEDLWPLAQTFSASFPDTESLLPDGFQGSGAGEGRQWWSVEGMTDQNRAQRIEAAGVELDRWLDEQLAARALGPSDLTLFGFSQGAALAVSVGSRRTVRAVVSFCGKPALTPEVDGSTAFLLINGAQDPFIPVAEATRFPAALRARGVEVEFRLMPGLGHGIDDEAMAVARAFVASRLAGTK